MSRFSDIRRGAQLNAKLQAYITYLSTPRTPNLGTRGARDPQIQLYVVPYSFDVATDEVVPVRAPVDSWNLLSTFINGAGAQSEAVNTLGSKVPLNSPGFRPARVIVFQNTTRSVTVTTSDITGGKYLKYAGTRHQSPFGRKVATDDMVDGYNIIEAALKARTGFEVNRVSLQPERVSGR